MKVDFLILGAQKCGTTTLFNILNTHPNIVGCNTKEPDFFSQEKIDNHDIDRYHSLYKRQDKALYFEASTTYTFYPYQYLEIWDRIYSYNPEMKFIYLVRNPFDRIVSSYMHLYTRGYTDLTIEKAIIDSRFFIDITRYYTQISPYISKFGRNNILILDFEDLTKSTKSTLDLVSKFLNFDIDLLDKSAFEIHRNRSIGQTKKHHKFDSPSLLLRSIRKVSPIIWEKITDNKERNFKKKPKLSDKNITMISNLLELEIKAMENLMNKDLNKWLSIDSSLCEFK